MKATPRPPGRASGTGKRPVRTKAAVVKKTAGKRLAARKAVGAGSAERGAAHRAAADLDALLTRIHSDIDEAHRLLDGAAR
jgi:hypothetical protein